MNMGKSKNGDVIYYDDENRQLEFSHCGKVVDSLPYEDFIPLPPGEAIQVLQAFIDKNRVEK